MYFSSEFLWRPSLFSTKIFLCVSVCCKTRLILLREHLNLNSAPCNLNFCLFTRFDPCRKHPNKYSKRTNSTLFSCARPSKRTERTQESLSLSVVVATKTTETFVTIHPLRITSTTGTARSRRTDHRLSWRIKKEEKNSIGREVRSKGFFSFGRPPRRFLSSLICVEPSFLSLARALKSLTEKETKKKSFKLVERLDRRANATGRA